MGLNSQHYQYTLLTSTHNWNAQEISKHTQIQEIIADLKDKNQKHVSKHKSIPCMSLWFIKGRSQARVSPFKGTSTQTIYRHLLKIDFYKEKKNTDSCASAYSYRAFLQSKPERLINPGYKQGNVCLAIAEIKGVHITFGTSRIVADPRILGACQHRSSKMISPN